mgnify:CR=1 FL=1
MSDGITWIASYPKSGNTMLRMLLEAYHYNSDTIDINKMVLISGDAGATLIQGMSPIPVGDLGFNGEALLRPAMLLNYYCSRTPPVYMKTHFANLQIKGLPPFIPSHVTRKAVYVVRDPRDVFHSFASYFNFSPKMTATAMSGKEFTIGGQEKNSLQMVSSWSNHVASWTSEDGFPVHIVKYEDLLADTAKELSEILEFLEIDVDDERVGRAVNAVQISKLQKMEDEGGFRENRATGSRFFSDGGGTRWRDEVAPRWIKQVEEDHGEVMRLLGYLETESKIKAVS